MTRRDGSRTASTITQRTCLAVALLGAIAHAEAQLYINEILFDPGSSGSNINDQRDEFIELRGPAGMSLDDHYLVFLESEDNATDTGPAGLIDNIFDLNGVSIGSNGFLVIRPGGGQFGDGSPTGPNLYPVVPGANDLVNTGPGPGYGSGPTSSIGASDVGDEGTIENGGMTAMLIHVDTNVGAAPVLNTDLDVDNDGLDNPNGQDGWTILDSITAFEPTEAVFGQAYGQVVFGTEEIGQLIFLEGAFRTVDPDLEPGAEYLGTGWEVEFVARWGNSTGQTIADWHATNLTINSASGSQSSPVDQRQSFIGEHGDLAGNGDDIPPSQPPVDELESSKGVFYGTPLLTNIGGPNYIFGDFNGDGVVDAADYAKYRETEGLTATETAPQPADVDRSFTVDANDLAIWAANLGAPFATLPAPSTSVPEPSALLLLGLGAMVWRRR